ncbi:MAG: DNA (cytosine-5-)-methyltransferase, partial [Candidatus Marinimicrobia bacterium]|nr:DNA (cytosine-5-)-methyltransferase [Candidatus Neomarinimicrobiota bacterium]
MFRVLDLFSGIGGFSLGLERAGMKTVAFVEIDEFCQKVLKKHWPDIPIFSDIRNFAKEVLNEKVDVICGGFPCQPFSIAGKRNGRKDNRYLWNEMFRVIQEFKPTWVIAENVHGILSVEQGMVFEQVCLDLESENYEVQSFVIPACAVNAPHRRDRVWIIANSDSTGLEGHGEFRKRSRKQFITEGAWKEAWIE